MSFVEIARQLDENGEPLYSSRRRAQEAVIRCLARGAGVAARELLTRQPATRVELGEMPMRLRRDFWVLMTHVERGDVVMTPEQRAHLAAAFLVICGFA